MGSISRRMAKRPLVQEVAGMAASFDRMHPDLRRLASDSRGSTMIEYVMIAALIAVVLVALLISIGTTLSGWFTQVSTAL